MKNNIRLELGGRVPQAIADAIPELPGLQVRADGRRPVLRVGGDHWPLLVHPRPHMGVAVERVVRLLQEEAHQLGGGALPLVADTLLPDHLRRALEQREISYLDGSGTLHLVAPGVIVHVEQRDLPRQKRARSSGSLGAVSVRAVQTLLARSGEAWTVSALAEAANFSLGQAHNVFELLQREGLVVVLGNGRLARACQ
jgi:hypothetical protein